MPVNRETSCSIIRVEGSFKRYLIRQRLLELFFFFFCYLGNLPPLSVILGVPSARVPWFSNINMKPIRMVISPSHVPFHQPVLLFAPFDYLPHRQRKILAGPDILLIVIITPRDSRVARATYLATPVRFVSAHALYLFFQVFGSNAD